MATDDMGIAETISRDKEGEMLHHWDAYQHRPWPTGWRMDCRRETQTLQSTWMPPKSSGLRRVADAGERRGKTCATGGASLRLLKQLQCTIGAP